MLNFLCFFLGGGEVAGTKNFMQGSAQLDYLEIWHTWILIYVPCDRLTLVVLEVLIITL